MARSRNIKPGFYKNEDLAECSVWARLLFPGLWMMADREGRLEDRPKRIKGEIFPYDSVEVEVLLCELQKWGFIDRYIVDSKKIIEVVNFLEHQAPHGTEKDSELPDKNGIYTVNERNKKNNLVTGCKKYVGLDSDITVNTPLNNGAITVNSPFHNALIPDSLIPDSLIPDSKEKNILSSSQAQLDSISDDCVQTERGSVVEAKHNNAKPSGATRKQNPAVIEIFDYWRVTMSHERSQLDPKREKIIADALKIYPLETLKTAILGCSLTPFNMGDNDRHERYDGIHLIFKPENIDRFIVNSEIKKPVPITKTGIFSGVYAD